MHRMIVTRRRQRDLACEGDLPSGRVQSDFPAGGHGRELQAPARTEHWNAACKDLANKVDLPQGRDVALIDIQRRAGDRCAIVGVERLRRGPVAVRRHTDVDDRVGRNPAQHGYVTLRRRRARRFGNTAATGRCVALDNQQPQHGLALKIAADRGKRQLLEFRLRQLPWIG
jgi:hypothetical protein